MTIGFNLEDGTGDAGVHDAHEHVHSRYDHCTDPVLAGGLEELAEDEGSEEQLPYAECDDQNIDPLLLPDDNTGEDERTVLDCPHESKGAFLFSFTRCRYC